MDAVHQCQPYEYRRTLRQKIFIACFVCSKKDKKICFTFAYKNYEC
jgi:hypothetical protein